MIKSFIFATLWAYFNTVFWSCLQEETAAGFECLRDTVRQSVRASVVAIRDAID